MPALAPPDNMALVALTPDIIQSTESSQAKSINPKQAHMATENILESIFRDATFST